LITLEHKTDEVDALMRDKQSLCKDKQELSSDVRIAKDKLESLEREKPK